MKLQRLKKYFLLFLFILFNSPSYSAELKINFFDTLDEQYMLELVQELKYEDNFKRIKAILDEKQWIERYEIKRNFFNPSSINIFPRKPIFLWIFQYEKFKAKLGKDLDTHKFKNLSKTIEYLYAKTKNPSIVDLRSDAGIALKYDK